MSEPIGAFDEQAISNDLRKLVGRAVEDTLNGLLEEVMIEMYLAGCRRLGATSTCTVGSRTSKLSARRSRGSWKRFSRRTRTVTATGV